MPVLVRLGKATRSTFGGNYRLVHKGDSRSKVNIQSQYG